jgi:formylglycine-generating enzyme required for sulfatase activity
MAGIDCGSTPSSSSSEDAGGDSQPPSDASIDTTSAADSAPAVDSGPQADGGGDDAAPADAAADVAAEGGPVWEPDGATVWAPSCAPGGAGMTNCGSSAAESCCTSLPVQGGKYNRTYTYDDAGSLTGEADPATVSDFRLDKYVVTVGRFRQFVNAIYPDGGASSADAGLAWTPDAGAGKHTHLNGGAGLAGQAAADGGVAYEPGWLPADDGNILPGSADTDLATLKEYSTWTTSANGGHENLPINGVTWAEAYAFCIWDGGFLPSEAEWEYAAAGGSQQREYPWGSTSPGTNNDYAIYSCNYGFAPPVCKNVNNYATVGTASLGAGLWGQLDLAGEVYEWMLDWYASPYPNPCADCTNLSPDWHSTRSTRGGDIFSDSSLIGSWFRGGGFPPTDRSDLGIRCARTP